MDCEWPKAPTYWLEEEIGFVSVPFTWNVPEVVNEIKSSLFAKKWYVGGPAVYLQRELFQGIEGVIILDELTGVLQRVNPKATKTSVGCPNKCGFCAAPKTEGALHELDDWPDLPIICDNNLLACSEAHIDRVFDQAEDHEEVDFNGGLDFRRMTPHILERLARLKSCVMRIALDSMPLREQWAEAVVRLREYRIPKSRVRSYVLVGYKDTPENDWKRCEFVEGHGILPLPQWYHPLDATKYNAVTEEQKDLGWTWHKQLRLMQWFYKRNDIGEAA